MTIAVIIVCCLETKQDMHLLSSAILAFDDQGVATAGALVIVILSLAALVRSKMPS